MQRSVLLSGFRTPERARAAEGLYLCRAVKEVFPGLHGMLVIFTCFTASMYLFSGFGPSQSNYSVPLINTDVAFFVCLFLYILIDTVFPVGDLWHVFISHPI